MKTNQKTNIFQTQLLLNTFIIDDYKTTLSYHFLTLSMKKYKFKKKFLGEIAKYGLFGFSM